MDWEDVRLLLTVEQAGSLTAAAKQLGVNHGTLSRRLAALEKEVAAPLFDRGRDGVRATRQGEEILALARQVRAPMQAIERHLEALAGRARPHVRIATSSVLARWLAPHLPSLLEAVPELRVELMVARRLIELTEGEADVALRVRPAGAPAAEPSIVATRIGSLAWGLYDCERQAQARGLIRYTSGVSEPGAAWLKDNAADRPTACVVDDVPTAFSLVRAGVGAGVLPCFMADEAPELRPVVRVVDSHRLFIAVHEAFRRAPRIRAVIRWLTHLAKTERARLEPD